MSSTSSSSSSAQEVNNLDDDAPPPRIISATLLSMPINGPCGSCAIDGTLFVHGEGHDICLGCFFDKGYDLEVSDDLRIVDKYTGADLVKHIKQYKSVIDLVSDDEEESDDDDPRRLTRLLQQQLRVGRRAADGSHTVAAFRNGDAGMSGTPNMASMQIMFRALQAVGGGNGFLDLGSGTGEIVLGWAVSTGNPAVGVEICADLNVLSSISAHAIAKESKSGKLQPFFAPLTPPVPNAQQTTSPTT